jgi:hypothetical protein
VGYAFLFFAVIMLGFEVVRYLDVNDLRLMTVEQAWQSYSTIGLGDVREAVAESYFSGMLGDILNFLVGLPLLSVLLLTGAFLMFISRHSEAAG